MNRRGKQVDTYLKIANMAVFLFLPFYVLYYGYMLEFLTTVPFIYGMPIFVWLGIVLLILLIIQFALGIMMVTGKPQLLKYHRINALFIAIVVFFHAYYGLGIWFFHFKI